MIRRSAFAALAVLLLMSCDTLRDTPTQPGVDGTPQYAISDGANSGGNPNFYFLPPMVKHPGASGPFDGSARPVVKICQWDADEDACGLELIMFDMTSGIHVNPVDELYQVDWKTDNVIVGETYRIRVYSGTALLGFADVAFPKDRSKAKNLGQTDYTIVLNDGRTLPIKFRIEEHAELTAVGCDPGDRTVIQDCDVVFVPAGYEGEASVETPGGSRAGKVKTPAIGENVYLTLLLLQNEDFPAPGSGIPQIPYFVDVSAVNAAGQPVTFPVVPGPDPDGASLVLCQADGDDHGYDEHDLRLFRVDEGGEPQLHPLALTDFSAPECPGHVDPPVALFDSHGHPTGHSPFDVLVDRGKRALAGLLLPQPLHAVHGGLNGRGITEFSQWGATVVDLPVPVLEYTGFEPFTVTDPTGGATQWIRYKLEVVNWRDYSDALFRAAPDLPPCGANPAASRTWVEIFAEPSGSRVYGFCALDSADDLQGLWVVFRADVSPPPVYITMWDRKWDVTVTSNTVSLSPS